MAKTYHSIGQMKTKKDKDENGNVQYLIEIDKKYLGRISIDGIPLTSKYVNVERPTKKFDKMLAKGSIDEVEYDQKMADFSPEGKLSFVKFDIQIVTEN